MHVSQRAESRSISLCVSADNTITGKHPGAAGNPERTRRWTTYHVWRFGELVVRLTRLEAPGHRRRAAHHLIRLEGAPEDPGGAVLHNHLGIGMNVDG